MIHYKGRLEKVLFNEFLEEQIQNIALLVSFLEGYVVLLSGRSRLFKSVNLVKVNSGILLNGVDHRDSLERLAEIHFDSVIHNCCCAEDFLCYISVEVLGEVHHSVVVGVSLIKLHESELGVVACVKTLVAEYSADFINSLKTAYDETLQVKLKRNTELKILVERVEVSFKRSCRRSSRVRYKHRSFNFHESL